MKLAIVHDWFNTKIGGAERVAFELANLFPEAPVYTLIYNPDKFKQWLNPKRVKASYLNKLPRAILNRSKSLLPLIPRAVKSLDLNGYDIILSSSFGFVKNLTPPRGAVHICYCHTPMRFAWDYQDRYLTEIGFGKFRQALAKPLVGQIKRWDSKGSSKVDVWLANSETVAQRIKQYYGAKAQVIYPPIDTRQFKPLAQKADFYITASALTPYKKLDLVVEAFNQSQRHLLTLGEGSDRERLAKLANPNIKFAGFVPEAKKRQLLAQAKALVFPNEEDFGIAPVEALASGTPVIAYKKGGLTETVKEGITGVFFTNQTAADLNRAIDRFEQQNFNTQTLVNSAQRFDRSQFAKQIKQVVSEAYSSVHST